MENMDFCAEWLNRMLTTLQAGPASTTDLFAPCADLHYQVNRMDELLAPYIGNLEGFCRFLESAWGWKITLSADARTILVDENKDFCVCPIAARLHGKASPMLCNCSACFAQKMFAKVCGKKVTACVKRSILRDGQSCMYEIRL